MKKFKNQDFTSLFRRCFKDFLQVRYSLRIPQVIGFLPLISGIARTSWKIWIRGPVKNMVITVPRPTWAQKINPTTTQTTSLPMRQYWNFMGVRSDRHRAIAS